MSLKTTPIGPDEKISVPGVYEISMARYHGDCCVGPSVSTSGLKKIWTDSEAHYFDDSYLNPNRPDEKERPHFSLGRAAHHLLFLGRKGFDAEFVVRPEKWKDYRTDAAKEWKADAIAAGLTVITDGELEQIAGMARSLAAEPMVKAGILDGLVERSLIFRDPETGVWLKSRPDNITTDGGDFSDLKTAVAVDDAALDRTMRSFHYQMQAGLAATAAKACADIDLQSFTFVFVEATRPHCVRVKTLDAEDLLRGEMQIEAATRLFARSIATGIWPGPGGHQQDAEALRLDDFTRRRIDERLELLKASPPAFQHAAE